MELYDLIMKSKNGDKDALYNIIIDFEPTIRKLSYDLHYEEAKTDLIIELIKLVKNVDENKFWQSTNSQIAKYVLIHLRNRAKRLSVNRKRNNLILVDMNYKILIDNKGYDIGDRAIHKILIESLTEKQQKIIILKYFYGLSDIEISELLMISRQAVNRNKNRALKNLRRYYM